MHSPFKSSGNRRSKRFLQRVQRIQKRIPERNNRVLLKYQLCPEIFRRASVSETIPALLRIRFLSVIYSLHPIADVVFKVVPSPGLRNFSSVNFPLLFIIMGVYQKSENTKICKEAAMEKFIPYEKMSKKERRKLDRSRRQTWGCLSPVTRKPENSRAYNRQKANRQSSFRLETT